MDTLETLPQMEREHQSWLMFVRELKRASGGTTTLELDLNEETQLHAAVTLWGEELAALRRMQDEDVIIKALDEARARYNREIGFLPY